MSTRNHAHAKYCLNTILVYKKKVCDVKAALKEARKENDQQRDVVNNAERVQSSLSRRILSMQVNLNDIAEPFVDCNREQTVVFVIWRQSIHPGYLELFVIR